MVFIPIGSAKMRIKKVLTHGSPAYFSTTVPKNTLCFLGQRQGFSQCKKNVQNSKSYPVVYNLAEILKIQIILEIFFSTDFKKP